MESSVSGKKKWPHMLINLNLKMQLIVHLLQFVGCDCDCGNVVAEQFHIWSGRLVMRYSDAMNQTSTF